jgi:hypothetical protein
MHRSIYPKHLNKSRDSDSNPSFADGRQPRPYRIIEGLLVIRYERRRISMTTIQEMGTTPTVSMIPWARMQTQVASR